MRLWGDSKSTQYGLNVDEEVAYLVENENNREFEYYLHCDHTPFHLAWNSWLADNKRRVSAELNLCGTARLQTHDEQLDISKENDFESSSPAAANVSAGTDAGDTGTFS